MAAGKKWGGENIRGGGKHPELTGRQTECSTEMLQRQKVLDPKEHDTKVELIEAQEDFLGRQKGREKDKASEALQEKVDPKKKKKIGETLAKKEKPYLVY